ncbi:hypothetical protein VUJ46_01270 [Chryseobacterium sp. MYb264]|uniref:hypothetical protein n=1 Tax=Chryseobacterium sp. MYb264 TaxID=2745153 RepID=UPI002E0F2394|nr:hypothetical protein VUJ46_01270 [Chryseobacterium sp. MYb264]
MNEIINEIYPDSRIIDISIGIIKPFNEYSGWEYYGTTSKNEKSDFPFPPLFIPIVIDYNSTPVAEGIIKHWFLDRTPSFGYMDFGSGFQIGESAKNSEQFIKGILFEQFLNEYNSVITDELLNLAHELNISNEELSVFNEISRREINNTECFLPSFIKNQPLNCVYNEYDYRGGYPSNENIIIDKNIDQASFFEIFHKEWIGYNAEKKGFSLFRKEPKYKPIENIPEWLKPNVDKKDLFENYIDKEELGMAWLTLNGPGFNPTEVGERLQRLKEFSNEKGFHLWVDFWCAKYGNSNSFVFI